MHNGYLKSKGATTKKTNEMFIFFAGYITINIVCLCVFEYFGFVHCVRYFVIGANVKYAKYLVRKNTLLTLNKT